METQFSPGKQAAEGRKDREEHSHAPSDGQIMVIVSCREPGAPELLTLLWAMAGGSWCGSDPSHRSEPWWEPPAALLAAPASPEQPRGRAGQGRAGQSSGDPRCPTALSAEAARPEAAAPGQARPSRAGLPRHHIPRGGAWRSRAVPYSLLRASATFSAARFSACSSCWMPCDWLAMAAAPSGRAAAASLRQAGHAHTAPATPPHIENN